MKAAICIVATISFLAYVGWDGHKDNIEQDGIRTEITNLNAEAIIAKKVNLVEQANQAETFRIAIRDTIRQNHYCAEHNGCAIDTTPKIAYVTPRYMVERGFFGGYGNRSRDLLP